MLLRIAVVVFVLHASLASAEDLWLASSGEFPGRLRLSEGGTAPRVIFSRSDRPDRAYPDAIMKVSQIAVASDQEIYYCSGLDGSLMHLLNGRHEIQSFVFPGQIRDLACTGELHTVYFSVVPTPQNGEALADGTIYRRDFWDGEPQVVASIRQQDLGSNWWGTFTIKNGEIFLVTLDSPSKIFRWAAGNLERVHSENPYAIKGITVGPSDEFIFTDGSGEVRRTFDFVNVETLLSSGFPLSDVAHRSSPNATRP